MPIGEGDLYSKERTEAENLYKQSQRLKMRYIAGDADFQKAQRNQEGWFKQKAMSVLHGGQEGLNAMANLPTDLLGKNKWADIDYVKPREGTANEMVSVAAQYVSGLLPAMKIVKRVSKPKAPEAPKAGTRKSKKQQYIAAAKSGAGTAAVADFIAFDGHESLVMNLLDMNPELQDAYAEITGKDNWHEMSSDELAELTQGLGSFDADRMLKNWGGRGANVLEGAIVGSFLSVFWKAAKLKWLNGDEMTDRVMRGEDEKIKAGVDRTQATHGKAFDDLTDKEKQEHLAFQHGRMQSIDDALTPEQQQRIQKEEAELAAAQADHLSVAEKSKAPENFERVSDDVIAPEANGSLYETNAAAEVKAIKTLDEIIPDEAYDADTTPFGNSVRQQIDEGRPLETSRLNSFEFVDADEEMTRLFSGIKSTDWVAHVKVENGYQRIVNDEAVTKMWNDVDSNGFIKTQDNRKYEQSAFKNQQDFEDFLLYREDAKLSFRKLKKETLTGYQDRMDRVAADRMKREGRGSFWKYEFEEFQGMKQFKVEDDMFMQYIFKDPDAGRALAKEITAGDANLDDIFMRSMDIINIDTTMTNAGQKYMTARLIGFFQKQLRAGYLHRAADPLGNQFAKAIGWHGDPNRQAAKDFLRNQLLNDVDDIATSMGLTPQGVVERFRMGRGDFDGLWKETSIDDALKQDVQVTKELYIRTWAYRLDQALHAKQLESVAEAIANTGGKPSTEQLARFATVVERMEAKLAAFRNLREAEGRALAANRAFQFAEGKGLGGGDADKLLEEIINRRGGKDGLNELANKVDALLKANKANPKGASAAAQGLINKTITGIDMHNEYWLNSILSGFRTQVVNTIGTLLHMVYKPIEGVAGALGKDPETRMFFQKQMMFSATMLFETFRVIGKLGLNKARLITEGTEAYMDGRRRILDSTDQAVGAVAGARKAMRRGKGTLESRSELFDMQPVAAISGDRLSDNAANWAKTMLDGIGNVIRIPSRLMITTDELFKQIQFRSASMAKLYGEALQELPSDALSADNIQKYMVARFQGLIRSNGARHTPDIIKDEAYREYAKAVTRAEKENRPIDEEYKNKQDFILNYVEENYTKRGQHGALSDFAMDWAEDSTFTRGLDVDLKELQQKHGLLEGKRSVGADVQDFVSQHAWARLVAPFVRTPLNLIIFPLQRLPILHNQALNAKSGWVKNLHQRYQADMLSGDPVRIAQAQGRMRMGALMYTSFGLLAASGAVTGGGPSDPQQRRLLQATGWRPYSFRIGDTYYSYGRLDPFSTVIGLCADIKEFIEHAGETGELDEDGLETVVMAGLHSFSENIANKSYLAGLSNILSVITDPNESGKFQSFMQKQMSSYIPKAVSQFTIVGDNRVKSTYGIMDAMQKNIPGLSASLEPKRNILGDPMEIVEPDLMSRATSVFNPFLSTKYKRDDVLDQIAGLRYNFANPEPRLNGKSFLDMRYFKDENGRTAYDYYQERIGTIKVGGKTMRDALKAYFKSKKYKANTEFGEEIGFEDIDADPRIQEVKRIFRRYRKFAKTDTLKKYPDLKEAQKSYNQTYKQLMAQFR